MNTTTASTDKTSRAPGSNGAPARGLQVVPYLFFDGRCEEAAEFYRSAVGAEIKMMMRYKDSPEPQPEMCQPMDPNKILHMTLQIGESTVLASDGPMQEAPKYQGFSLSVTVPDVASAERVFAKLADGGQVHMPMAKTFFSPRFGMLADRFGVMWMVYVSST